MRNIKKSVGKVFLACGGAVLAVGGFAQPAFAVDWNANSMIHNAANTSGMNVTTVNGTGILNVVQTIANWALGIALALVVGKVVATAIDRMVFGTLSTGTKQPNKSGVEGGMLQQIPVVGAYNADVPWKEVWIHFAKHLAIVAAAYLAVQIIAGAVVWFLDTATKSGSAS